MKSALADKSGSKIAPLMIREIEEEIVSGTLMPGMCLPGEETLRRKYGCSRPAVREALQCLKTRGLVVGRRGSGNYVADTFCGEPVRDSIKIYSSLQRNGKAYLELLDLRLMIESFCVLSLVSDDARPVRIRLREKLGLMKKYSENLASFGEADIAFHFTLVEGAGHELFSSIMEGLLSGLGIRFAKETYLNSDLVAKNLADHEAICGALENGDASLARRQLCRHLEDSRRHLEELLAGRNKP